MKNWSNLTDPELLEAIRHGNHEAFGTFFNRYWDYVFGVVHRRLGDEDTAKDIVQQIFIRLWENRRALSIRNTAKPYLFSAAKNQLYNLYRSNRLMLPDDRSEKPEVVAAEGADTGLLVAEISSVVNDELERMPVNIRRCFQLSRDEGKSIREIAAELSLSEKTVRNNISDALKRLRIRLGHQAVGTLSGLLISGLLTQ